MALLIMVGGCFQTAEQPPPVTSEPPAGAQATVPLVSLTPDPAAPAILLTLPTDAGPLHLIRYRGGQGVCLALTFDPQTLAVNRCGLAEGVGRGFVESLTAPDGRAVRVVFGLAPHDGVTAVALEFADGRNAPAVTAGGGYALLLEAAQTPVRATAIDQFGYMAGQWAF
ncbi:MAG: hypothetical protein Kow0077_21120 [Anaerolineae bacterium]